MVLLSQLLSLGAAAGKMNLSRNRGSTVVTGLLHPFATSFSALMFGVIIPRVGEVIAAALFYHEFELFFFGFIFHASFLSFTSVASIFSSKKRLSCLEILEYPFVGTYNLQSLLWEFDVASVCDEPCPVTTNHTFGLTAQHLWVILV